jgi:uncharacterized membrane protein
MADLPSRLGKAAAIAGLVLAPIGVHVAMATHQGMAWAGILIIVEAVAIAWIALSFVPTRTLRWTGCAAVLIVTFSIWWFAADGVVASSAVPHAIAYLSVLTVFAASLMPGRKPIVTVFAERSRGVLPRSLLVYTRRVTVAWCLFCAGQLLVSLLLLLFAPTHVWSMFVNVFNFPLLGLMFCGEFAWRTWRHGSAGERLTDGFRLAGQITTHDGA